MLRHATTRRAVLGGFTGLAALGTGVARAALPKLPASAVTLNIVDAAGNLALTQPAFEAYRKAKPNLVSRMAFTQAPSPELPGKLRAQQAAGRLDIDMVLIGTDSLSAGIQQDIWTHLSDYADGLPKPADIYPEQVMKMQALAQGQAVCHSFCPGGPILEYLPEKVATPPDSIEGLLAWTKANPKRFLYARPANSGPGRAFLMGVPYLLGDKDPKDPKNGWDKSWAFFAELGKNIEYYPSGTGAVMQELGQGSRDMTVSMTGWDINPRALGVVPKSAAVTTMKGFHFVTDAHYMAVPKGIAPEKLAVLLDLMSFMLEPKQQAVTYDKGYFYPGPAVKGATLEMAPQSSQDVIAEYGRVDYYTKLLASTPMEVPLDAASMVYAFQRWDEQIGAKVGH